MNNRSKRSTIRLLTWFEDSDDEDIQGGNDKNCTKRDYKTGSYQKVGETYLTHFSSNTCEELGATGEMRIQWKWYFERNKNDENW